LTQNKPLTLHNPVFSFRTISAPATGSYREKGSRFLAFAYPVTSEAEISGFLQHLKKEYFDARHHCYAWVLGADKRKFRANDDGEPNHSAGDPILGQIRSHDLTNVLVVVVRYFGGTKLGVGGLINAYRIASADAISQAQIVIREVEVELTVDYGYACSPEVMRLVKEFDLTVMDQAFNERAELKLRVRLKDQAELRERLRLLSALHHDVRIR
jgi:uncharacterized YigZ family protein